MENNLEFEVIDMKDFMTEDEISNFWIDMYVADRDYKKSLEENKGKEFSAVAAGKTVTITITKDDHFCDGRYKK